jgi:hypothetical protein
MAAAGPAAAESCPDESFATAVDATGASLRKFNAEAQPKLNAKLKELSTKKGWNAEDYEEKGLDYLQDNRLQELDAQANELLTNIDGLGRPEPGAGDCAKLHELSAAGAELLAVMKTKTAYLMEKIDKDIGTAGTPAAPQAPPKPPIAAESGAKKPEPPREVEAAPPAKTAPEPPPKTAEAPPPSPPSDTRSAWETTTALDQPPGEPYAPPSGDLLAGETNEDGYTIDEIREATRGFFGTISTNLASVLEHAFRKSGRPTAYVLGTEGGGAFLAGVRYGEGTLYLRSGGTQKVFWHGPSLGSDIGADGSRTLFLIYRLKEPAGLYRSFTGIDGTAYFVGGVGLTFLKGGQVIMAPIRSGVGLRLGASIGYIRFTPHATWNPF